MKLGHSKEDKTKKEAIPSSVEGEKSLFHSLLHELRKRKILETFAAFIGGGWLIIEFVHWILVDHYHFPEKSIDIAFISDSSSGHFLHYENRKAQRGRI
jgi:hypothetical protein